MLILLCSLLSNPLVGKGDGAGDGDSDGDGDLMSLLNPRFWMAQNIFTDTRFMFPILVSLYREMEKNVQMAW